MSRRTLEGNRVFGCLALLLALGPSGRAAWAASPRMESALAELAATRGVGGQAKAASFAATHLLTLRGDSVLVTIRPTWGAGTEIVDFDSLAARGVRVLARSRHFIRALVPIDALEAAASSPGVAFVQRPITGHPLITSEGVSLTGAGAFQSLGFDGSGAKVAVLDNGFIDWVAAKNHGELPASVVGRTFDFSGTGFATDTEHGTAVAEAIYDMAPGADLYLMKIGDAASLEIALDTCIARGIDVINHSVGWFGQPGDGTGPICAVADDAKSAGILWVNAAGNHAWGHNEGVFTDSDADDWHEFGSGSEEIEISTSPGDAIRVFLTWDAWPTTSEDYDLYLVNAHGSTVASSTDRQSVSPGEPVEFIGIGGMPAGTYRIKVKRYSASSDHAYDIFVMDQDLATHRVIAGSLLSPADAVGAFAVAAIGRTNWAAGPAEYFSSQGPTNDGRLKPELAAPDNCNSYTYGYWYGTSLASPHVAGAAALLLSANPSWSVESLRGALLASAIDLGAAGPDSVYGYGKLHVSATAPNPLVSFAAATGDGEVTLSWTNPADAGFQSTTIRFSTSGYPTSSTGGDPVGVFAGPPGSDSTFVHTGLVNGTTYWYSAFTYNGVAYSSAVNAHAEAGDLTPPASPALALVKGDESILYSWTAPADADLAGVRIVYSTGGYPTAPDQGTAVPNGNAGNYPMAPSTAGADTLAGIVNGTTYFFAAFAYDAGPYYSTAALASATPEDTIPPDPVFYFQAEPRDGEVRISWTHPSTPDFAGILVRFSTLSTPAGPADGDPVPNGSAGLFPGTPGDARYFDHTGLANGTTYHYAAFAYDEVPLYAGAATAAGTPSASASPDTIPPSPPPAFTANAGDGEVYLAWTNPADADFTTLRIRYAASGYPATPHDGDAVENGAGGFFPGDPGASGTFTHEGRTNGARVYYAAFAYDGSTNRSAARTADAVPADTTAPDSVTLFRAIPSDEGVSLSWTSPADTDFAYAVLRYDTLSFPRTPAEGLPVPAGRDGIFPSAPGERRSFVHTGLLGGVTYRYAAFAFDADSNHSAGTTVAATPADHAPPRPLPAFTATPGENTITLRWTNPADPDLAGTMIRYSPITSPATPGAGFPVPNRANGFFPGEPGAVDSFVHTGVANLITYRYAAFTRDRTGLYGPGAAAAAAARDTIPPPPPVSFSAEPSRRAVTLRWTNADSRDLVGTFIVFSTTGVPGGSNDGTPVPSPFGGFLPGEPAAGDSFVHRDLEEGRTYSYAAFSYDAVPNLSAASVDSATTLADETPPDLALGLFLNPYLIDYLDIYILASEPLDPESLSVTAAGIPVAMARTDTIPEVWAGKIRLSGSGTATIDASACDRAGNGADVSGSLAFAPARKGEPVSLTSSDGALTLRVPEGGVAGETVFYIVSSSWDAGQGGRAQRGKTAEGTVFAGEEAYALSSAGGWPALGAEVEVRLDPAAWGDVPAEEIAIEHSAEGSLGLTIDEARSSGTAVITSPGTVRLARDPSAPSRLAVPSMCRLLPNVPNPFNPRTVIRFEVGAPVVARLTVHSVSGRLVRTLFEGRAFAGMNEAVWDGLDREGAQAGSGLYLVRLETERAAETRRMLLLR